MDPKKKPMSAETKEKGRQFVTALLEEQHDYRSIQANVRAVLVALIRDKKINTVQAAAMFGVTPQAVQGWFRAEGFKRSFVLEETA